jgi:hypothetical protein
MIENAMDESTLKQYLADDPPTVVPLAIKPHFEALNDKEKKYAHYISRAAFAGTRINLRYALNHLASFQSLIHDCNADKLVLKASQYMISSWPCTRRAKVRPICTSFEPQILLT